jgi:hypothetical protein
VTNFLLLLSLPFLHSRSPTLSLSCVLVTRGSSVHFLTSVMARIKSTTRLAGVAAASGNEGHGSDGSTERMEFVALSDTGYHSGAGGDMDEGFHTQSYFFGPSTVTVSHIHGMIDNSYFPD